MSIRRGWPLHRRSTRRALCSALAIVILLAGLPSWTLHAHSHEACADAHHVHDCATPDRHGGALDADQDPTKPHFHESPCASPACAAAPVDSGGAVPARTRAAPYAAAWPASPARAPSHPPPIG